MDFSPLVLYKKFLNITTNTNIININNYIVRDIEFCFSVALAISCPKLIRNKYKINFLKKKDSTDLYSVVNWKRSLRFSLTLIYQSKIFLWLTFRKNLTNNIKQMNLKSRWLIQCFFFFKNIHFFIKLNLNLSIYFFFYKTNSFFFNSIKAFLENFNFFFQKWKHLFVFIFFTNFSNSSLTIFKKIKSIKKFRKKIYNKTNRNYLATFYRNIN